MAAAEPLEQKSSVKKPLISGAMDLLQTTSRAPALFQEHGALRGLYFQYRDLTRIHPWKRYENLDESADLPPGPAD
jgi:hypothetical protein